MRMIDQKDRWEVIKSSNIYWDTKGTPSILERSSLVVVNGIPVHPAVRLRTGFNLCDLNINMSRSRYMEERVHRVSWCRLAVLPSVNTLKVKIFHTHCIVENEDGVTVRDVLDAVRSQ